MAGLAQLAIARTPPRFQAGDTGPNAHPNRELILAALQVSPNVVPAEISEAVLAFHEDPTGLAAALVASAPPTLVHGDARLENFGLNGNRLVAID